jgi:hypothetical protein
MPTEKDMQFLQFVYDNTRLGKLNWEGTADPTKFVVSLKGKYKVTVDRGDDERGGYKYWMTLFDESERELVNISVPQTLVGELYNLAHRNSLNIDATLDEIMESGLDDAPRKITDDDIPF